MNTYTFREKPVFNFRKVIISPLTIVEYLRMLDFLNCLCLKIVSLKEHEVGRVGRWGSGRSWRMGKNVTKIHWIKFSKNIFKKEISYILHSQ